MGADKLNEKLDKAILKTFKEYSSEDETPAQAFSRGFDRGVEWLMQQPLSDRLTDEEKEKIRHCMNEALRQKNNKSIHYVINERNRIQSDAIIVTLKYIFGEELFNEKNNYV